MVGTIIPVVHGDIHVCWRSAVLPLYAVSSTLAAGAAGASVATIGMVPLRSLSRFGHEVPTVLIGLMSLIYAAHELGFVRVPIPQIRRQVPARWRSSRWMALKYGVALGAGIGTHI